MTGLMKRNRLFQIYEFGFSVLRKLILPACIHELRIELQLERLDEFDLIKICDLGTQWLSRRCRVTAMSWTEKTEPSVVARYSYWSEEKLQWQILIRLRAKDVEKKQLSFQWLGDEAWKNDETHLHNILDSYILNNWIR
jgi:hypothetical protein